MATQRQIPFVAESSLSTSYAEDFGKASQSHFAFRVCAIAETLSSEKKAERASDHRTEEG